MTFKMAGRKVTGKNALPKPKKLKPVPRSKSVLGHLEPEKSRPIYNKRQRKRDLKHKRKITNMVKRQIYTEFIDTAPTTRCTATSTKKRRNWLYNYFAANNIPQPPDDLDHQQLMQYALDNGIDPYTIPKEEIRCSLAPIEGGTVCRFHGGRLPNVAQAAKIRMAGMVMPALDRMFKVITKSKHDPSAVAACKDILDRVGFKSVVLEDEEPQYDPDKLKNLTTEEIQLLISLHQKMQGSNIALPEGGQTIDIKAQVANHPVMEVIRSGQVE